MNDYPLLDRATVAALLPLIDAEGVSLAARGKIPAATPQGFTQAFFSDDIDTLATAHKTYRDRRRAFVKRHTAAGGAMWKEGHPTRRHLALIAWAYSPTPAQLTAYLRREKLKNRQIARFLGR